MSVGAQTSQLQTPNTKPSLHRPRVGRGTDFSATPQTTKPRASTDPASVGRRLLSYRRQTTKTPCLHRPCVGRGKDFSATPIKPRNPVPPPTSRRSGQRQLILRVMAHAVTEAKNSYFHRREVGGEFVPTCIRFQLISLTSTDAGSVESLFNLHSFPANQSHFHRRRVGGEFVPTCVRFQLTSHTSTDARSVESLFQLTFVSS